MISLTSILVVGGIFVLANYDPDTKKVAGVTSLTPEQQAQEKIFSELANKDSDADGLKDWEEALWKTDIRNPDTDNDGTSDSVEIQQSRNPILRGPNDGLAEHPISRPVTITNGGKKENLTSTDKFARTVFTKYMTLKQGGVPLTDPGNQADLVRSILLDEDLEVSARVYTKKDFALTDDSEFSIRAYGNTMANILTNYSIASKDAAVIAKNSIDHNNPEEIAELDPLIKSYENILSRIDKVKVPPSAANIHIGLLNSTSDMLQTIKNIRALYTDPLISLKGFGHYGEALPILVQSIADLRDYFLSRKITFAPTEDGYAFGHVPSNQQ